MTSIERYRKANPWGLTNIQNSIARCGRFPTKEAAVAEADKRGGVVEINEAGRVVLFSAMPLL